MTLHERNEYARLMRERRRELDREIDEVRRRYHERLFSDFHVAASDGYRRRYRHYRRHLRYGRPIGLAVMLLFWVAVIAFSGFPLWFRVIVGALAALSMMNGILQFVFFFRMDKRVLVPLERIEDAAREIAKGNYDVAVDSSGYRETAALSAAFNAMARALREGDELKKSYEENRKDLVANISHDLKTPMTSILGYVDAISDIGTVDPGKVTKYLSIIKSNAGYMNRLIDDLFLFSRLDVKRFELAPERVDVRLFLRDMMEEFQLDAGENGFSFEYADGIPESGLAGVSGSVVFAGASPSLPVFAFIDPKMFSRVMRNLVDNARKYGPDQGLRVVATSGIVESSAASPTRFFVSVEDNGAGLPAEALGKIFERFFRADAERAKDVSGTGLGLAIARELVEAHGGSISASNAPGGGLRFTVELPAENGQS